MTSALSYVELAEQVHGSLPRRVGYEYVWGDALQEFRVEQPHARIVNLETSVTASEDAEAKGINYRMHPENVPVLSAAGIDCCVLANNHVLDWGRRGLIDTLEALGRSSIRVAGAGRTQAEAEAPAIVDVGEGSRVLVFGLGAEDSGIPPEWAAGPTTAGVNFLPDFSDASVARVSRVVELTKQTGDIAVASIHWGDNWGYEIPSAHRRFARALIDRAAIDVVHGHSSHHPMGIEVYRNRPILYGCGDFLNDYEGISGYELFRADLAVMYFVTLDAPSGELVGSP